MIVIMNDDEIKLLAIEATKLKYKDCRDNFETEEEWDAWILERVDKQNLVNRIKSFMKKFNTFNSELISMTASVTTFIAAAATYIASAVFGAASAIVEYNTAGSQLKTAATNLGLEKDELNKEADSLGITMIPPFSVLWSTFSSAVDTYINLCSSIPTISMPSE